MTVIVRVRFRPGGSAYDYDATALPQVQRGDFVVVPTQFGPQVGEVLQVRHQEAPSSTEPQAQNRALEAVLRRANAQDLALRHLRQGKEVEILVNLRARLKALAQRERRYRQIRIVEVELSLDDRHVRVLYTAESDEGGPGGALRKAAQRLVGPRQVHWVRLGPRDAAKLAGGVGACGLPQRCCNAFLGSFQSVSVRMAKVQNISLSPTEISGMCGRLRCCLRFEFEQYVEARQTLPKERSVVQTPEGVGRVVAVQPLARQVTVEIPDKGRWTFHGDEIAPARPNGCAHCPHAANAA